MMRLLKGLCICGCLQPCPADDTALGVWNQKCSERQTRVDASIRASQNDFAVRHSHILRSLPEPGSSGQAPQSCPADVDGLATAPRTPSSLEMGSFQPILLHFQSIDCSRGCYLGGTHPISDMLSPFSLASYPCCFSVLGR